VVGHNAGIFLRRARSGRGCLTRASVGDRAVAARVGLAWLTVYGLWKVVRRQGKLRPVRVLTASSRRLKPKMWTSAYYRECAASARRTHQ
jgi:hypothetical protein